MAGPMRTWRALPLAMTFGLAACTGGTSGTPAASQAAGGSELTLSDGSAGLVWGDGAYGLVLVHGAAYDAASWAPQAAVFAEHGMTVLAVEETGPGSVLAALNELQDRRGVQRVALLGASAGTAGVLAVGRDHPALVDQLILLSGNGDVTSLGEFPKLFTASEGEPAAADARRMADEAPGDWNALYLAPGSAHAQAIFATDGGPDLLDALVRRLEERR